MSNSAAVSEILKKSKRVALMGHKQGDVDSYGATFALAMCLESLGIQVEVISGEKFPDNLDFLLNYFTGSVVPKAEHSFDTFVILDTSDLERTVDSSLATQYLKQAKDSIYIDHHTKGDLSEMVSVSLRDETVSSTSELIFEVITDLGVTIDKNIASLLLAGIIADTSSFQNQNTTERALTVASELLKKGARQKTIVSQIFGGSEVDALKLWGLAMDRLNLNKSHGVVSTYLTNEDITSCGISGDAVSGIVNYLNQIAGARMVMLVTEEDEGQIKVSFRTRDDSVDVAAFARQLGGGGHVKASGLSFAGSLGESSKGIKII